jgi:glycerophosphoryl diester phosphodiesterase
VDDAIAEYEQFFEMGVDGLFSDNPDTAVEAR